jgi:hypothetical protein
LYFVLLLLKKVEDNRDDLTKFIREMAIQNSTKEKIHSEMLFLVRVYNEEKVLKDTIDKIFDK